MRKPYLIKPCLSLILSAVLLAGLTGCAEKNKGNDPTTESGSIESDTNGSDTEAGSSEAEDEPGEPIEFISFRIVETGDMAEYYVYEAVRTEDGAHLERAIFSPYWDEETEEQSDRKEIEAEIDGDQDFYMQLCQLLGTYHAEEWDGFHEVDEDVLDGGSISFDAELEGGGTISAYGGNCYPPRFGKFFSTLWDLLYEGN